MLSREKALRVIAPPVLIFNTASAIVGIAYAIIPVYSIVWDLLGIVLLAALFGNLIVVFLIDVVIDKSSPQGKRLNWISYGVLLVTILGMMGVLFGNLLLSFSYSSALADTWALYVCTFASFFSQLTAGGYLSWLAAKYSGSCIGKTASPPASMNRDRHRAMRICAVFACCFAIGFLTFLTVLMIIGSGFNVYEWGTAAVMAGLVGVVAAMFGVFWCFSALAASLMLVKVTRRYRHPRVSLAIMLVGLVISAAMFVPLVATPLYSFEADSRFAAAFGADWESRIPAEVQAYFLPVRISLPAYFLGIPPKDCVILKDQLFHMGTGSEEGLRLHFDAYLPLNSGIGLPGRNSTLIRIHGGAWTVGDKGLGNMLQMNKYFAAQGYCIFDIQYGLSNNSDLLGVLNSITPRFLLGNYSINDMIRHIGIFCNYLLANPIYGANLSSVFVSGGSAGGHLACATALAITNGSYTTYFDAGLTIRGFIPYYPANRGSRFIDNNVSFSEFYDPGLLVTSASPPCLIYQGTADALVPPPIAQAFKDAYTTKGNEACAIMFLPLSGHAGNIYYSGFYNTFFTYYMERFMFLYR